MKHFRKITSLLLTFLLSAQLLACGGYEGDAPINAKWKCISLTTSSGTTNITGFIAVYDKIAGVQGPEFVSNGTDFTFSMNGKDHTGYVVPNGDVYELYWDDPNSKIHMSTATIDGDLMTLQMSDTITVVFQAK